MSSYIDSYLNENNDVVFVYCRDIKPFHNVEVQHVVIKETDLPLVIANLKAMFDDIGE